MWDAISDLAYLNSNEGLFEDDYKFKAKSQFQNELRKILKTF